MHIYILGIHMQKGSKQRSIIKLFWPYTYENVWQCKISSLMLFTLTVYPKMNVKPWEKIGIENAKVNIFYQTYLKFSYDWKWNSAEQNEEIVQSEYYTAFIFSTVTFYCCFYVQLSYIYFSKGSIVENGIKVESKQKRSFLIFIFLDSDPFINGQGVISNSITFLTFCKFQEKLFQFIHFFLIKSQPDKFEAF